MPAASSSLWSHRDFLRLWAAQSVSALGSRFTRTALPVIAVLAVDGSPLELGLLSALSVGPGAIAGLLLGGRIDRSAKRPLLISADIMRAVLVLTIPAAAGFGALSMLQLYVVAAAVGCATVLFQITDNAYVPALVGKAHIVEANSKLETTEAIAEVAGPALAGILIDVLTAPVAMVIDAATYVWSAFVLGRVEAVETPAPAARGDSVRADLRSGFVACWREPRVRALLLATGVSTLTFGVFSALYMFYTLDEIGLSPAAVGMIIGVGGVAALCGALVSWRLAAAMGVGRAMIACLAIGQAGGLLIPLAGEVIWLAIPMLVAHQFIGDAFLVAFEIQALSLRQAALPLGVLARANAVFAAVNGLLLPVGALAAGAAGDVIGVRATLWVGIGGGLLAPLLLLPLRQVDAQRLDT
jgi:predicted MFS family arabinose efflux permease